MDSTPNTRLTLLEKIKDPRDAQAWDEFTAIYYPLVFEICLRKGLQHADATDVAQEVLTRVSEAIGEYKHGQPGSTFRGWLYCITRNLTIDYFRRRAKDPLALASTPSDLNQIKEPSTAESAEFQVEFKRRIFAIAAKSVQTQVAPKTWAVFWQTEIEGKGIDVVAEQLGMSTGASYVCRYRVISKLRDEVQKRINHSGQSLFDFEGEAQV